VSTENAASSTLTFTLRRPERPGGIKLVKITPTTWIEKVWEGDHLQPTYHYKWEDEDDDEN